MINKKMALGLIGFLCLNGTLYGAPVVTNITQLENSGGEIVANQQVGVNFYEQGTVEYLENLSITATGYDTPNGESWEIGSYGSDVNLGKTTLIWNKDLAVNPAANTAIGARVASAASYNGVLSLGDNSWIEVYANASNRAVGITAVGRTSGTTTSLATTGDGTQIQVNNIGSGSTHGVRTTGSGSEIQLGENNTIIVQGNSLTYGIDADERGKISAGAGLVIQVTSEGGPEAAGVFAHQVENSPSALSEAILNGADITVTNNGTQSRYALYAGKNGKITANSGIYHLRGDVRAYGAGTSEISVDFANGSTLTGKAEAIQNSTNGNNGVVNFNMAGTTWNMTDTSMITSLVIDNASTVAFTSDTGFKTLTIDSLSGAGNFSMRTDIEALQGDLLVVNDAAGTHKITVANSGSADVTGTERLVIVDTITGNAQFELTRPVELGGYIYDLRQVPEDQQDWELFGALKLDGKKPSTGAKSAQIFSGAYLLNYAENQTLLKRMGDLRDGKQGNGVWARVFGGKFTSSSDGFLHGFDMDYWGLQAGMDKKIDRKDGKGADYVGGFLGYSKGSIDYLKEGSSSIDSKSLGAYWTHIHRNGFYADTVLKYNWMNSDFKAVDYAGEKIKGDDINTQGITASLEVGRRYFFNKTNENGEKIRQEYRQGWYVEPQVQLTFGHQSGGDFKLSNGLKVKADSYNSVLGRAEMHLGYEIKEGRNPVNIYGKIGIAKEFDGDVDYSLNNSRENTSYGDTWKLWGVGITAQFKEQHNLYFEVERASGGQFNQKWGVNGGYRFSW